MDGVTLDHPSGCWKLLTGTQVRPLPGVRAASVAVPGRAGVLPMVGEDVEATTIGLHLGVRGVGPDGVDRGAAGLDANLQALYALFGVRHRLLDVRYRAAPGIGEVAAEAAVISASEPQVWIGAARARLAVVLRVPGVYWRDSTASAWTTRTIGAVQRVEILDGATAPVVDAVLRITGPMTDLRITDTATGGWVGYPGALATGRALRVHCGRMDAHEAPSVSFDGTEANATGRVVTGGPGSGSRFLALTPRPVTSAHDRGVQVLVEGTGTSDTTLVELRARRAYL
ncbi:hypothetical protein [Lentzea aerocolonigenes]|uniref:hypothetical protein n=1 Tax=Lentzea aerocolonigenes TaxID=68170 RepID=UPI0006991A17|nr:hypothetical protein [Lentzea aerocolonigenes]